MSKSVPMFENVEFQIEKEVWNLYELRDGKYRVTLRMRTVLTKLLKPRFAKPEESLLIGVPSDLAGVPKSVPKHEFQMSFQQILVVADCPPDLMGKPSRPIPPSELNQMPAEEVDFTPFNEEWNVYTIPSIGHKLKVKLVVSSITKPKDVYDQFGYPIYIVQSTNAVVPVPPRRKK